MIFDTYFDEYCEKFMFKELIISEIYIFSNQINIKEIPETSMSKTTGNVHNPNLGPAIMMGRGSI